MRAGGTIQESPRFSQKRQQETGLNESSRLYPFFDGTLLGYTPYMSSAAGPTFVVLSGDYASTTCTEDLRRQFTEFAAQPDLVLDFSGVSSFADACTRELFRMQQLRSRLGFDPATIIGASAGLHDALARLQDDD